MNTSLLPPVLLPVSAAIAGSVKSLAERLNLMTEEEIYLFCRRNPELKFERRADSLIEFLDTTGGTMGCRTTKLISRLDCWAEEANLGQVFDSSTGLRLPNEAVCSLDVAWVRTDAWQALALEQQEKSPPLCPDFMVELASPSDALAGLTVRLNENTDNGCCLAHRRQEAVGPHLSRRWLGERGEKLRRNPKRRGRVARLQLCAEFVALSR